MTGMKLTSTVARSGVTGKMGIRGKGGHQHVKFLIRILYGTGGVVHV